MSPDCSSPINHNVCEVNVTSGVPQERLPYARKTIPYSRKSILWWIQRAERLSRVNKMVEAMEKYKQKQMESIHELYQKRVQLLRDNYHSQVECMLRSN